MITRLLTRSVRLTKLHSVHARQSLSPQSIRYTSIISSHSTKLWSQTSIQTSSFHSTRCRNARGPTADALMENLTDLYATAKDEFEIAAEETTKKTVYAQDDRDAAREALTLLKEALEKAVRESDPEVAKEVTNRVGPRIRELENAVIAMEESAMED